MSKNNNRIGEEKFNNKGLRMKIIAYRNSLDIDVLFLESGIVSKNKTYNSFKNGEIAEKIDRLGEIKLNNQKLEMKIIAYRKYMDIDVLFIESGIIVTGKTYDEFKKGSIRLPMNRVGEVNTNTQGLEMKIIAYRKYTDIDVLFTHQNIIEKHREYTAFKNGTIRCKSEKNPLKIDRTGETGKNNRGFKMEIISYRNCDDIDIYFPEYNKIAKNRSYSKFKSGEVACPFHCDIAQFNERMGEIRLNNAGEQMKIIEYRGSCDIDVLFTEYNLKVENERYKHFIDGSISRPTYVKIEDKSYIVCGDCKEVLHATTGNFRVNSQGKLGLDTICITCVREREKRYREEMPHVDINKKAKRRYRKENQGRGISREQYDEMMEFFGWKCAYSGKKLNRYKIEYNIKEYSKYLSIDHVISLSNFGLHEIWNLVPCRFDVNSSKFSAEDWKKWYRSQLFYCEEREKKIVEWIDYAWKIYGDRNEFKEFAKSKWGIEINGFIDRLY